MSQPFSRILHPFDVKRHPRPEPEVAHALLARWASDRGAPSDRPAFRWSAGTNRPRPLRGGYAMRSMADGQGGGHPLPQ